MHEPPPNNYRSQGNVDELVLIYQTGFKRAFGQDCVMDKTEDLAAFAGIVGKVGFDRAKLLVGAYFNVKDDWLRDQAYPVRYLTRNLNKVIASLSKRIRTLFPKYIVAYTDSGIPVMSYDLEECKNYRPYVAPTLLEEWTRLPTFSKLPNINEFSAMGFDTSLWLQKWDELSHPEKREKTVDFSLKCS